MAAMSVATRSASVALDFFIGNLLVDTTAIAQQALDALGNCFFCSGQTTIRQVTTQKVVF
jgi:hypothetical protein